MTIKYLTNSPINSTINKLLSLWQLYYYVTISSQQSLYIFVHKPRSGQVAILAVYTGTTVA